MGKRWILKFLNFWPPFLGAGVRVKSISKDFRQIEVQMRLHFWNKNYVRTHFGGSLYAMTDPFYMLMLLENLGKEYIVWDKGATIRFLKPGKGTVRASFNLSGEQIQKIIQDLESQSKLTPTFLVQIKNDEGEVIAEVDKLLYIRKKAKATQRQAA